MRLFLLALFGLLVVPEALSPEALAQTATLEGRVLDRSRDPLPGANVYLSGTGLGTTADDQGRYRLEGVPLGAYRLVASVIGYEAGAEDLALRRPGEVREVDFRLRESEAQLGEVTVEATRDEQWQRRFEYFKQRFLGESANAAQTEILNPYVLDFEGNLGALEARAAEPLIIENRALGYRIRYDLREFEARSNYNFFDGEPFYEELVPEDAGQFAQWQAARRAAYLGSPRHLLRSLIAGTAAEEEFELFVVPGSGPGGGPFARMGGGQRVRVTPEEILVDGRRDGDKRLTFRGILEVIYTGEGEAQAFLTREWARENRPARDVQTSQIRFPIARDAAELDRFGRELDPRSITLSGYMAFERFADDLPYDYGLAETGLPGAAEAAEALRQRRVASDSTDVPEAPPSGTAPADSTGGGPPVP